MSAARGGTRQRLPGRHTRAFLAVAATEAALLVGLLVSAVAEDRNDARSIERRLAASLELTDLALWSGTSYARHPSQADLYAPFSEHPAGFEHSPSGSIVPPPRPPPGAWR